MNCAIKLQRTLWPVLSSFNAHCDLCYQASTHTVTCAFKLQCTLWPVLSSFNVHRELCVQASTWAVNWTVISSFNTHRELRYQASTQYHIAAVKITVDQWINFSCLCCHHHQSHRVKCPHCIDPDNITIVSALFLTYRLLEGLEMSNYEASFFWSGGTILTGHHFVMS